MRSLLLVPFVLAAVAAQASDTFKIDALSLGGGTGILNLSNVAGLNNGAYYAGPFDAHLNGGATERVFCADLLHETAFNQSQAVSVVDTATLGIGYRKAAQIYNLFGGTVGNDAVKNGGLQAAIWSSIFPTVHYSDWTSGISAQASSYLSADLTGISTHARYYSLGESNQSMLGGRPNPTPQAVPEPASMAALGLGALGLLRRRKRA